jgi:hypothetical protein
MLPDEIWFQIAAYCSADTLCTLDLTSKSLRSKTAPFWAVLARKRYGLFGWSEQKTSKEHWRAASALLRPGKAVCVPLAQYQPEMSLCATNRLAMAGTTGQTIVMGCDDHQHESSEVPDAEGSEFPLLLRDARESSFMEPQCLDGGMSVWTVAVTGSGQNEVIVMGHTSGEIDRLVAIRRNPRRTAGSTDRQPIIFSELRKAHGLEDDAGDSRTGSLLVLGSPQLLLVAQGGYFFVFKPAEENVLELVGFTTIERYGL